MKRLCNVRIMVLTMLFFVICCQAGQCQNNTMTLTVNTPSATLAGATGPSASDYWNLINYGFSATTTQRSYQRVQYTIYFFIEPWSNVLVDYDPEYLYTGTVTSGEFDSTYVTSYSNSGSCTFSLGTAIYNHYSGTKYGGTGNNFKYWFYVTMYGSAYPSATDSGAETSNTGNLTWQSTW